MSSGTEFSNSSKMKTSELEPEFSTLSAMVAPRDCKTGFTTLLGSSIGTRTPILGGQPTKSSLLMNIQASGTFSEIERDNI